MSGTKARRTRAKHPWIGTLLIDLFNVQCPLFLTDEARLSYLRKKGFDPEPAGNVYGLLSVSESADGDVYYCMILTAESSIGTWAHEASHLVDFLFDRFNVPTDVGNTEVRAYMLGGLVDQIHEIMWKHFGKSSQPDPQPNPQPDSQPSNQEQKQETSSCACPSSPSPS